VSVFRNFDFLVGETLKKEAAVFVPSADELQQLADEASRLIESNEPLKGYRLRDPVTGKYTLAFVAPLLAPEGQAIVYDPLAVGRRAGKE
jgi:hypothetical protein